MCGILGAMPAVQSSAFKEVLDLLVHRGPDAGVFGKNLPSISRLGIGGLPF